MPKDYTGQTFGDWTVIGPAAVPKPGHRRVTCRCACGVEREVLLRSLIHGKSTSCGKCKHDITGQRFGRLTVLEQLLGKPSSCRVLCDCGAEKTVLKSNLVTGGTTSCGCLHREVVGALRRSHGASGSRTYRIWSAMKTRCSNPRQNRAEYYVGKGVRVCQRWQESFDAFLADMGEAPDGMSIDRIDGAGDYDPGNCKWSTAIEQSHNRSDNVWVEYEGEWMVVAEAERRAGLSPNTARSRMKLGWPEHLWFAPPIGRGNHLSRRLEN